MNVTLVFKLQPKFNKKLKTKLKNIPKKQLCDLRGRLADIVDI